MYQQRNVATVIIFSIITCGIYSFYWIYVTTRDLNNYLEISDMEPAIELLLCFLCFPYMYYWIYKYAQRITDAHIKAQIATTSDEAIVCLILAIFGLSIISIAIMQNNLNKAWAVEQSEGI